jgi:hypothetical protein
VFKRVLVAILGVLLVAVLVGPSGAAEPRTTVTRTITVPAGAFSPNIDDWNFTNSMFELYTLTGTGTFNAPIYFEAAAVTIKKITLYAYDNRSADDVCVGMVRTTPAAAFIEEVGRVCSSGASTMKPRVFSTGSFEHRAIASGYGPVLWVFLPGPMDGYRFYGVKITYSYETGA